MSLNVIEQQSYMPSYNNMEDLDIDNSPVQKWSNRNFLYQTQSIHEQAKNQQDITLLINEIFKKTISKTVQIAQDKELDKKTPSCAVMDSLLCCEKVIQSYAGVFDISDTDYQTDGLLEDLEPASVIPDAWIRSQIQVDHQNIELYDQIGSLPDLGNHKKSIDTKSVYSTISKYSTYSKATSTKSGVKKKKKVQQNPPIPIDLTEPLFITEEESQLRKEKEEEKRIIQKNLQKIREEKLRQEEEAKTKIKEQKQDKNVIGVTFDYSGEELMVHRLKVNKLPPTNVNMLLDFTDPQEQAQKLLKKNKKTPHKNNQNNSNSNKNSTNKQQMQKSQTNSTLPPIKMAEYSATPMDTIQLNEGVKMTYEGRKRIGPKPNSQALMYLTGTFNSNSSSQKLRLNKKDYEKIVQGQDKLGSHKLDQNKNNQRLMKTLQEQNQSDSIDSQDQYYNTFSNFKQSNKNNTGEGIQIHKSNIMQQLASQIDEEDENLIRLQKIQKEKEKQFLELQKQQNQQSAIDKFNQTQIVANNQWGKQHQDPSRSFINTPFSLNKPNQKNLLSTLGKVNKPRSRNFIQNNQIDLYQPKITHQTIQEIKHKLLKNDIVYLNTQPILQQYISTNELKEIKNINNNTNNTKEKLIKEILMNILSPIATIRTHSKNDTSLIWDVKPKKDIYNIQNIYDINNINNIQGIYNNKKIFTRSHTDQEFTQHTDSSFEEPPPQYIALGVINADFQGYGLNSFLKVQDIIDKLSQENLEVLENSLFKIRVPLDFHKNVDYIRGNLIFNTREGKKGIRYRDDIIDQKELLNKEQIESYQELQNIIKANENSNLHQLSNGYIVLLNNQTFTHARTKIKSQNRHLIRARFDLNM
ncbi:hypothetical protein PPERSA_11990 [Pseudocohnilembus persalinus]|uniref:TauD/TfdA-like domain-containing protein n=1 Tax=Pseudocohnilembus persalinus TaxID=266149 RepID=A0A0V0QKL0_PSEPJ|nr:hypothetical protein PPERSA_11990 [Pseudocohnilembus persalinus]|eukprot:KRX02650.1 hypothetical protein PPERSA_11990 [Pseudocohnilembus persalinus]